MNLSFDLKSIAAKAGSNVGLVLWIMLLVLIALEGLVLRQSITIMLSARHVEQTPLTKLVRVNFNLYDTIAKRFEQQGSFTPSPVTAPNPFGRLEKPKE
jgi:hypothetical protein